MNIEELWLNPPRIHLQPEGLIAWIWPLELLKRLSAAVPYEGRTIETGIGTSTVLFALRRTHHICISPDLEEVNRLREYCQSKQVPLDRVEFIIARSEEYLPIAKSGDFDFALIDGGHGFPVPFLDWYYLSRTLKVGGKLVIDDVQLWTGKVLRDFALGESEWELDSSLWVYFDYTVAFKKTAPYDPGRDWNRQSYTQRKSLPRKIPSGICG